MSTGAGEGGYLCLCWPLSPAWGQTRGRGGAAHKKDNGMSRRALDHFFLHFPESFEANVLANTSLLYIMFIASLMLVHLRLVCTVGYNEFDFCLENKEYRIFDGCKIEI